MIINEAQHISVNRNFGQPWYHPGKLTISANKSFAGDEGITGARFDDCAVGDGCSASGK